MKTTISVFVKNEGLFSRAWSFLWFINIFKKLPVKVTADFPIDGSLLVPSKNPYVFEVEPGVEHVMVFTDPRLKSKKLYNKLFGIFFGGTMGLGLGMDFSSMIIGGVIGSDMISDITPDLAKGSIKFELKEGDDLQIRVQAKTSGVVKIKVLN